MAEEHGVAGEWARARGTIQGMKHIFVGLFVAGAGFGFAFVNWIAGSIVFVAAALYSVWRLQQGVRMVESYFKGARGEERVAAILRGLPDGYHIFNDYEAGKAHIDHVVIGPTGVFAVETKLWRGRVTIDEGHVLLDGQLPDRSPIDQVLKETDLLKQKLARMGWTGAVTPILTFASNTFNRQPAELKGAVVINSSELIGTFKVGRALLTSAEVERLVALMNTK